MQSSINELLPNSLLFDSRPRGLLERQLSMNRDEALASSEAALQELAQALAAGHSEALTQYLNTMATFHRYSFGNLMLILRQFPRATVVAGFHKWRHAGRWVKQGEKGIAILAPLLVKRKNVGDADSESSDEALPQRTVAGFRVVYVYDVSQTDGKELTDFASITGEPGERLRLLEEFVQGQGILLTYAEFLGGARGVSRGGSIEVLQGLSAAETFAVLVHEVAHEMLHRGDRREQTTKTVRETEAEAVSYVVSRAIGLDCSTKCVDYIHMYAGDAQLLLQSLELIRTVSSRIICALETPTGDQGPGVATRSISNETESMPLELLCHQDRSQSS